MKNFVVGVIIGVLVSTLSLTAIGAVKVFNDVPKNAWYASAIFSLKEKGIVKGFADGSFKPNANITRAEMAVIIDNLLKYLSGDLEVEKTSQEPSVLSDNLLAEVKKVRVPDNYKLDVPFISQAPHYNWNLPYGEACEEASLIMVKYFLEDETLDADEADGEIVAMVDFEEKNGYGVDVGAQESLEIAREFYGLEGEIFYGEDVNVENIKKFLAAGYPVIIPVAGQLLGNPNFTGAGPPYHMIVIVGFDEENFITHDPGTHKGANYKYSYATIENAIHDWNGAKSTVLTGQKAMLVLRN